MPARNAVEPASKPTTPQKRTWRHSNFFQHEAWLSAKVPRVKCDRCGVRLVSVPWARPGSGFTLHLVKVLNEAVDVVRREEVQTRPELAKSRSVRLKNPANLREEQREQLAAPTLPRLNQKTARAWHIELNFQELFQQPPEEAETFLKPIFFLDEVFC